MTDDSNFDLGNLLGGGSLPPSVPDLPNINVNIDPLGMGMGGGWGWGSGWGYGSRWGYGGGLGFINNSIIGSLLGALFGMALLVSSFWLIYWNEGKAVDLQRALDQQLQHVVELDPDTLTAVPGGQLVHITGWVEGSSPVTDPLFKINLPEGLSLRRKVEMYQWQEIDTKHRSQTGLAHQNDVTATYQKGWSAQLNESSHFRYPEGHDNPAAFPSVAKPDEVVKAGHAPTMIPLVSARFDTALAKLGAYKVGPDILARITGLSSVSLGDNAPPSGFILMADGAYYRGGDSANPQVGDVRVSFEEVDAQPVGIMGALSGDTLTDYHNGANMTAVLPGKPTAQQLFRSLHRGALLTWVYRGLAFFMIFFSFLLIAEPVTTVASWIPFLGALVEMGVFFGAFIFALPVTFSAVALAWIGQRPVLAGIMVVASVGISAFLFHRHLAEIRHDAQVRAWMDRKAAPSHK